MKRIAAIVLLSVVYLNANAQNDAQAKKILDELSAKTKAYTSIKAEFTFVNEKKDKTKDTQNGKIETKGNKYKLEIPGHEIYCDGKTVWDFIKDANEVQIKDMEAGVSPTNKRKTLSILDRKEAIKTACHLAQPGDIILVAGKGHEKYQEINGVRNHFDDKEILLEQLKPIS